MVLAALIMVSPEGLLAAFELLNAPEEQLLTAHDLHWGDTSRVEFHAHHLARYGLAELGVVTFEIQANLGGSLTPNRGVGWPIFLGVRYQSTGDDLYRESRVAAMGGWSGESLFLKGWVGVQSIAIKGYGSTAGRVGGGSLSLRLNEPWLVEIGADGVRMGGGLDAKNAPEVLWAWGGWSRGGWGLLCGGTQQSRGQVRLVTAIEAPLSSLFNLGVFWEDRPGRIGGSLTLHWKRTEFDLGYLYQPILGLTRNLGISAEW